MSEDQKEYQIIAKQEVDDAATMLGAGYMEIHPPSSVITGVIGENGLQEHKTGTWIKLSTSFRAVMSKLKGSRLSVFLCVCLHIDAKNNCFPSLETIARETGYSRREVINAVHELEESGFLTVNRDGKRSNFYHVDLAAAMGAENSPVHFATKNTRQNAPKEELIKEEKRLGANAPALPKSTDPMDTLLEFERLKQQRAEREGLAPEALTNIEAFPPDCKQGARLMYDKFQLLPPAKPRSGKGGDYADWLNGIRDLSKLCAEYHVNLEDGFNEFWKAWNPSPFTFDRPGAMTKTMRAALARTHLRDRSEQPPAPEPERKPVPRPAGIAKPQFHPRPPQS